MGDFHYYQAMDEEIDWFASGDRGHEGEHSFAPNPLYYFMKIRASVIREIGKAYLISIAGAEILLPKSICKEVKDESMYVHTQIFKKIMQKFQEENTCK